MVDRGFLDFKETQVHGLLRWHVPVAPLTTNQETILPQPLKEPVGANVESVRFQNLGQIAD